MAASPSDKKMPITTPSYKYLVVMLLQTRLLSRWTLHLTKFAVKIFAKYIYFPTYPRHQPGAKRIDVLSRVLFPASFMGLNVMYWSYYLTRHPAHL